jgi:carbon starvation protein
MPKATFLGTDKLTWVTILAIYGFIASVLPVWLLLQPRDYLESFQLYAGLILIYAGLFVTAPHFVAPAFRTNVPEAPPIWPFLFVTIACGALSGYHSIVASGTSSKQLSNEKDAKLVGYGGMLAEGSLGILSVLVCTAGFATTGLWLKHYGSWGHASGLGAKLSAFVDGASGFIANLGVPAGLSQTFVALIIVSFAMTTLDTSCRLGRYIVSEFGDQHNLPVLKNKYLASFLSAGVAFVLAIGLYGDKPAGILLWPLFGTTNQLLASLVFATLTIYLLRRKSPTWPTAVPAAIVTITTLAAMLWNIKEFVVAKNWVLAFVGGIILGAGLVLIYLGTAQYLKEKRKEGKDGAEERHLATDTKQ